MTRAGHGEGPHALHRHWDDPAAWPDEILMEPALAPATEALLDAVGARPGRRLLELACGLGQTTAAATARGADALGIDLSESRIAAARARFPQAKFGVADASEPPAGPWDAVVCRFGAHHLPEAWARAVLGVLAPRGHLAIAEWPPRDERDRENGMRPAAHWENALRRAGFEDVRVDAVATRLAALAGRGPELAPRLAERDPQDREVLIISARKPGRIPQGD